MALLNTHGWKFKQTDFFTPAEKAMFIQLRDGGSLSTFRIAACESCGEDVLKGKRFCSAKCKEKKQRETGNG